jgi:Cdc6-like AAA superfamily ATPase
LIYGSALWIPRPSVLALRPPFHRSIPDFVGREEVVFEVYRLLSTGISWLLVTGSPGTGKTALLEHIVDCLETAGLGGLFHHREPNAAIEELARELFTKTQQGRRIIPCHFMPDQERPRDVMLSLAKQVEELFPDCGDAVTRGADLYLANLLDRVSAVLKHQGQRLVIITDGLDQSVEALEASARLIPRAPAAITIVCSGRPMKHDEYNWMVQSGSFARIDLDDEKWLPSNESACVRYAE